MVKGLGNRYVDDPRIAGMYDDAVGATFVRDALQVYARTRMRCVRRWPPGNLTSLLRVRLGRAASRR
jgi:hypothetical protein